ncbi:hypothetical protein KHQ81_12855 [Mycoplasmatota bacterium]|nr:hypothetical protein KHQ81_12855 [Mycoplasmatota bacterium]
MILQMNDNNSKQYGDAKLIRKNSVKTFKYEQIDSRKYVSNDPTNGLMWMKASQSIKTHEELHFVYGDKIILDAYDKELVVANISKKVNSKQLMLLKQNLSVEYILDLA